MENLKLSCESRDMEMEPIESKEMEIIEVADIYSGENHEYESIDISDISNNNNNNKVTPVHMRASITIKEKLEDQDFTQRISVVSNVLLELYRVITSSLLIIFVPQFCDDHICTLEDNLQWDPKLQIYNVTIVFNFLTLFICVSMYTIELRRENRLIKYLDVNPRKPNDDEDVAAIMAIVPSDKKEKLYQVDREYQIISYIAMVAFGINSILSGIIVNIFYLNDQTNTTFVTYMLFMLLKLVNVYFISNTKKNVFYSAYLKTNLQFNDLDKNFQLDN